MHSKNSIHWTRRAMTLGSLSAVTALCVSPALTQAQPNKTQATIGMVLEPPGLDPTTAPAAAIGEIVHYNILEGLTKIREDGSVVPLLAESWTMDPDGRSYTFRLKKGVKFHDGEAFDASDVKFSFERAKDDKSTNKAKKAVFDNIARVAVADRDHAAASERERLAVRAATLHDIEHGADPGVGQPLLRDHPLVVIGYRGTERSIMKHLLIDQAERCGRFREGIYWCPLPGSTPSLDSPYVAELAATIGSNLQFVEIEGFDELLVTADRSVQATTTDTWGDGPALPETAEAIRADDGVGVNDHSVVEAHFEAAGRLVHAGHPQQRVETVKNHRSPPAP